MASLRCCCSVWHSRAILVSCSRTGWLAFLHLAKRCRRVAKPPSSLWENQKMLLVPWPCVAFLGRAPRRGETPSKMSRNDEAAHRAYRRPASYRSNRPARRRGARAIRARRSAGARRRPVRGTPNIVAAQPPPRRARERGAPSAASRAALLGAPACYSTTEYRSQRLATGRGRSSA